MKHLYKAFIAIAAAAAFCFGINSCTDPLKVGNAFLEKAPGGTVTADTVFTNAEYTRRFFGENIEYGVTCRNMYWVYEQMGRREDAIASLQKAKENFTRILGPDHDRTLAVADDLRRLQAG